MNRGATNKQKFCELELPLRSHPDTMSHILPKQTSCNLSGSSAGGRPPCSGRHVPGSRGSVRKPCLWDGSQMTEQEAKFTLSDSQICYTLILVVQIKYFSANDFDDYATLRQFNLRIII